MASGFISYTHADSELKDKLLQHLAPLQREGLIDVWQDGLLRPGEHLDSTVQAALAGSDLVILLVSAGFIASGYCYEKEMLNAFERQRSGTGRVIAIILRPCQWKHVPVGAGQTLADFVALPKDGKPVVSWADPDAAFDDAVGAIRALLRAGQSTEKRSASYLPLPTPTSTGGPPQTSAPRGSLLGLRAKPTDLDRDRFIRSGFAATAELFERKLADLKASETNVDTDFERVDSRSFTASVYLSGKRIGQVSIFYGGDVWRDSLCLSFDASLSRSSMNDWLPLEETEHGLAFRPGNPMGQVRPQGPLDSEGAANYLWESFLSHVRSRAR